MLKIMGVRVSPIHSDFLIPEHVRAINICNNFKAGGDSKITALFTKDVHVLVVVV